MRPFSTGEAEGREITLHTSRSTPHAPRLMRAPDQHRPVLLLALVLLVLLAVRLQGRGLGADAMAPATCLTASSSFPLCRAPAWAFPAPWRPRRFPAFPVRREPAAGRQVRAPAREKSRAMGLDLEASNPPSYLLGAAANPPSWAVREPVCPASPGSKQ